MKASKHIILVVVPMRKGPRAASAPWPLSVPFPSALQIIKA